MTENPPLLCGMQSTSDVPKMLAGVVEPPVPIHLDYCSHRSFADAGFVETWRAPLTVSISRPCRFEVGDLVSFLATDAGLRIELSREDLSRTSLISAFPFGGGALRIGPNGGLAAKAPRFRHIAFSLSLYTYVKFQKARHR